MDERVMQFRIGAMVLGAILVAAILMVMFGKGPQLLHRTYTISIEFPEAPGVNPKTPVRVSGILIGRVSSVERLPDGGVLVTAQIDADQPIYDDEICQINRTLLNDSVLEFVKRKEPAVESSSTSAAAPAETQPAGTPRAPQPAPGQARHVIPPGARLQGRVTPEPMQAITEIQHELAEAMSSAKETSQSVNRFFDKLNRMMGSDQDLARQRDRIRVMIDKTGQAMDSINELAKKSNALLDRGDVARSLQELPKTLAQARGTMAKLDATLDLANKNLTDISQLTGALGEKAPAIVADLDRGAEKLDRLAGELLTFSEALNKSDGTVGRLVHDPSLYNNLNRAAGNIQELGAQLEPVIHDARVFSDRIARHPEVLGVRGALKPSLGTKGVPVFER